MRSIRSKIAAQEGGHRGTRSRLSRRSLGCCASGFYTLANKVLRGRVSAPLSAWLTRGPTGGPMGLLVQSRVFLENVTFGVRSTRLHAACTALHTLSAHHQPELRSAGVKARPRRCGASVMHSKSRHCTASDAIDEHLHRWSLGSQLPHCRPHLPGSEQMPRDVQPPQARQITAEVR